MSLNNGTRVLQTSVYVVIAQERNWTIVNCKKCFAAVKNPSS